MSSKAGSVAHFQAEVLTENILSYMKGEAVEERFDGHANCFIESGYGKGFLLDFNYDLEPVPGKFPIPGIGPMNLLGESRLNHWGKMAFRWAYWNLLLKGVVNFKDRGKEMGINDGHRNGIRKGFISVNIAHIRDIRKGFISVALGRA